MRSSFKVNAHICVDDTNEDGGRCATPHGKVSPLHIFSVRRAGVCLPARFLPSAAPKRVLPSPALEPHSRAFPTALTRWAIASRRRVVLNGRVTSRLVL